MSIQENEQHAQVQEVGGRECGNAKTRVDKSVAGLAQKKGIRPRDVKLWQMPAVSCSCGLVQLRSRAANEKEAKCEKF